MDTERSNIKKETGATLWTRNFKLITVGTVISMMGNSIAGFALGLVVLDYTSSTFLYVTYMILYNAPQIFMPTLAGPFIDTFSRRKMIYSLDFFSAAAYIVFALLIFTNHFSFIYLVLGAFILGTVDSIYKVTYDSFYPLLIEEGNYSKAYSIQSTLDSVTQFMVPVSAFLYNIIGIGPLFIINAVSFVIAAVLEVKIKKKEEYIKDESQLFGMKQYKKTFIEGINYLKEEKGLGAITLYFTFSSFASAIIMVLTLPYFKSVYDHGEYVYIYVIGFIVLGRLIGGKIHYSLNIKAQVRFKIAVAVYLIMTFIDATLFFWPIRIMQILCFIEGILGVTSYNIRISATQSYVPDDKKGRFNGIFQMTTTLGVVCGQMFVGVLSINLPIRLIIILGQCVNLFAIIFVVLKNGKYVKTIFNRIS